MNKSLVTGLVGGVAVTAAAFAAYQAMDHRRAAEIINVEQLIRTVSTPRQICSEDIGTSQASTNDPSRVTGGRPERCGGRSDW
jgi:uncharacterized protein YcfJ